MRMLMHVINAALHAFDKEMLAFALLPDPPPWEAIYVEGILHPGGLLDIMQAGNHVSCCSMFNKYGWVRQPIMVAEFLHAYDIPLCMDPPLLVDKHTRGIVVQGLFPLVVTSIFCAVWSRRREGGEWVEQL
jgi:hypothetical protein